MAWGIVKRSLLWSGAGGFAGLAAAYVNGERKRFGAGSGLELWDLPFPGRKSSASPRVIVVGSGVAGVSTAWELARKGCSVVVVDAGDGPAAECSAVAAGGMQRVNPLVDPTLWKAVAKCVLLEPKATSFFHMDYGATLTDPHFLRWAVGFTRASLTGGADQERLRQRQQHMLTFTAWAIQKTQDAMKSLGIEQRCGFSSDGACHVKYTPPPPGAAGGGDSQGGNSAKAPSPKPAAKTTMMSLEPSETILAERVIELQPVLGEQEKAPLWAKHEAEAAMADSERFTQELAKDCRKLGVSFEFGTRVQGFESAGELVTAMHTNRGTVVLDEDTKVVVAAGSWTPPLLWHLGLFTPVYPLKGYCTAINLPPVGDSSRPPATALPSGIVSDGVVYTSRLGEQIRVTSMGELAGWSTAPDPVVDAAFRVLAKRQLKGAPGLLDAMDATRTRCGLRPFTCDGVILLGRLPGLRNAFVNTGPGFNGWKIGVGAGEVLAKQVVGGTGAENGDPFSVEALSPEGRVVEAPIWSRLCISRWC